MSTRAILVFPIITLLITWWIVGFHVPVAGPPADWFGAISGSHPLFFLATSASAIAGLVAGSLMKGGPVLASLPLVGAAPVVAVMIMMLVLGRIEKVGLRGILPPLLQRHMAALDPDYGHGGWIYGHKLRLRRHVDRSVPVAFQNNSDAGVVDDSSAHVTELEAALARLDIEALE